MHHIQGVLPTSRLVNHACPFASLLLRFSKCCFSFLSNREHSKALQSPTLYSCAFVGLHVNRPHLPIPIPHHGRNSESLLLDHLRLQEEGHEPRRLPRVHDEPPCPSDSRLDGSLWSPLILAGRFISRHLFASIEITDTPSTRHTVRTRPGS